MAARDMSFFKVSRTGHVSRPALTAQDQETAQILEQSRQDLAKGMGLSGDDAHAFLNKLRAQTKARQRRTDFEPG